jgi:hypothetical protein
MTQSLAAGHSIPSVIYRLADHFPLAHLPHELTVFDEFQQQTAYFREYLTLYQIVDDLCVASTL